MEKTIAKINPLSKTLSVINYVKSQTDSVILFYSGGKDSIVLLDILTKHFKEVNLVFMYFVKDLEHIEKYITWAEKKYNVKVKKYPHWMLSQYFNDNYYRLHSTEKVANIKLIDIETKAKKDFGCEWIFNGMKKADGLNRRLMLKTWFMEAINLKSKRACPLTDWKKGDCVQYIKQFKLPMPIAYNKKNSSGADLNADFLLFCKEKYPKDYEKVLKQFPFAEVILINNANKVSKIPSTDN
jgi:3'-phosphoadenosine 5'-phosphosulfate sulfotransferase (PAPS reductase)/FAD synthetase